jgi:HEAT repeat protein
VKKTLSADDVIAILEAPLDLSWRRRKVWDDDVTADPARHFYPRKVRLENEASVRALLKALAIGPTPRSRWVILGVLGHRGAKSAVPTIVNYLNDRSIRVRNEAADALWKLGDEHMPDIGAALLRQFDKSSNEGIRSTLALALGKVQYRPAIPSLIASLRSKRDVNRRCVASALAELGAMEAVEPLQQAIAQEQHAHTRAEMSRYLDQLMHTANDSDLQGDSPRAEVRQHG